MAPEFPIRTKKIIMDKKLIKEFGEDILCYRLRTERQKKRAQFEDFEKYLIQLHGEEKELWLKKRNLGWITLEPPVQKGWKRFFVLREDVARSRQADFFDNILKKINTNDWSYRKDFKVKRRRYGRKTYVVKPQKLMELHESCFNGLGFSEIEKQFFHIEHRLGKGSTSSSIYYVFNEPWRFALKVRPNIIDKVRERDEVLEARQRQIKNYLERNDYEKKQLKILYGDCRWRKYAADEEYHDWNFFKNKSLQRILDEAEEEIL
jgi:hypothetical protein